MTAKLMLDLTEAYRTLDGLHRDLGTTLADEFKTRAEAWVSSRETAATARTRDADYSSIEFTPLVLQLKCDIAQYEARVEFIKYLIDHGYTDYPDSEG